MGFYHFSLRNTAFFVVLLPSFWATKWLEYLCKLFFMKKNIYRSRALKSRTYLFYASLLHRNLSLWTVTFGKKYWLKLRAAALKFAATVYETCLNHYSQLFNLKLAKLKKLRRSNVKIPSEIEQPLLCIPEKNKEFKNNFKRYETSSVCLSKMQRKQNTYNLSAKYFNLTALSRDNY